MIDGKYVLAVIPARGGSKGLPGKNILPLAGKPLIAWSIVAALESAFVDRVVVSSEDQQIIDVAKQWKAEVPFVRPLELADDKTPAIDAVIHAMGYFPDTELVVKLQPTSPLRTSNDIDQCLKMLSDEQVESVISVCTVKHHPNWLKVRNDAGFISPYEDGPLTSNRHELPPVYALNGAIFAGRTASILENCGFHSARSFPYIMDQEKSYDIDSQLDFEICEWILRNRDPHANGI